MDSQDSTTSEKPSNNGHPTPKSTTGRWEWDFGPSKCPVSSDIVSSHIVENRRRIQKRDFFAKHSWDQSMSKFRKKSDILPNSNQSTGVQVANSPSLTFSKSKKIKDQGPLDLDLEKGKGNEKDSYAPDAPSELIKKKDNEIRLLKRKYDLLSMHKSRGTQKLEKEVLHLLEANKELHRMLDRYREGENRNMRSRKIEGEEAEGFNDELDRITAELERKDLEIEEKIGQIADLEEQLSSALQLKELLENSQPNGASSMIFRDEMSRLQRQISSAASFLSQTFSAQASELLETERIDPELSALIQATSKNGIILLSTPYPALCGLLFGFVRSHIFYSNCWTALHFEGYMLRAYQQVVQNGAPSGTLVSLQRAALHLMLRENSEFRECWVPAHVAELQSEFMKLLSPLLDPRKLRVIEMDFKRNLEQMLTDTFILRARCFLPRGTRYELIQFNPGDEFDPDIMQEERVTGQSVHPLTDGRKFLVKFCIHGAMFLHSVDETTPELDAVKALSQSFISRMDNGDLVTTKGTLISEKAGVVLESIVTP